MNLREQIKNDYKDAMKNKQYIRKDALGVLLGELDRQPSKELSNDQIIAIIKKLDKSECEILKMKPGNQASITFLNTIRAYLPAMTSDEAVIEWIKANINFSNFKNKMQAMGPIMKQFGTTVDGNNVKKILSEKF